MKPLPRGLIGVACSLLVLARAQAIAPWPMAVGNYFEGFGTIATWTDDFSSPTEATRWGSVAVNATGTIPDGRRTTVATSVFTTSTAAGVQRGTGNLVQLSTGATDNTSANAVDLYLDFTGRAPGTLAFDWTAVANSTGGRASSLRVYTTTNGVNFVELSNAAVLNLSNNVAASGSIRNVSLPPGFSNCATARIRFYEYNGTGGSSGQRGKIAVDNVSVTRVLPPIAITLPATTSNTVATLNGTVNPGGAATAVWFEWVPSPFSHTNLTAPIVVGSGTNVVGASAVLSNIAPGLIYRGRLVASNELGVAPGSDIFFGSPALAFLGAAVVTNECHATFTDPGASATRTPLAIAAGYVHSLALLMDGTVAAWGYNGHGQTTIPAGLSDVVAIAGGGEHSLALKRDGTLTAWGDNGSGQTTIPVGLSNVVSTSGGQLHSLALKMDGTVAAWGNNTFRQTSLPVDLSNVAAIAAGGYHSLALKRDGTVVVWGDNSFGQTSVPVGLSNVSAIAGGGYHSLALKRDGTVVAWGDNNEGQTTIPVGLSNVVAIAGGFFHSMALSSDGEIFVFGQIPVPVDPSNVVAIAGGGAHSVVLKIDGTLAAWGDDFYGQTTVPADLTRLAVTVGGTFSTNNAPGVYTRTYSASNSVGGMAIATRTVVVRDTTPPVITLLGSSTPLTNRLNMPFVDPGALALDACGGSLTLTTNSTVNVAVPGTYAVSYLATDGSGNSATNTRTVVVGVLPIATTLPVTGGSNAMATLNGTVNPGGTATAAWFEWGLSSFSNTNLTTPVEVGSGTNVVTVNNLLSNLTPGFVYRGRLVASNVVGVVRGVDVLFGTPVLTLNGAATMTNECHTAFADPGVATVALLPIAGGGYHSLALRIDGSVAAWGSAAYGQTTIPGSLSNVTAIAAGDGHSLALKSDGTLAAWGYSAYGQTTIPAGLSNVIAVGAGGFHSLALKNDGTVAVWGRVDYGQTTIPVVLSNVTAVAGGYFHSLVLMGDGTIVGWGHNGYGQASSPVGLSNVVAITGGGFHSLALKGDGTVVAWGFNPFGQTSVPSNLSNVMAIASGYDHCMALKDDGTVVAWGRNSEGQTIIPAGLDNVVAIAAGGYHSLAVKRDGTVVAWGYNVQGQGTIPANLRVPTVNLTVGGTFNTNNLPGTYARIYSTTNLLGGIATATRTIVVLDTLPPAITLLGNDRITNQVDVPFVDPGATALDTCGGSLAVTTNSTVNVAVPGIYSVSYTAMDSSGNSATNTRTVVVGTAPFVATLPATAINTVATLNGTVSPGSLPVTVWFEWKLYGATNAYLTAPVIVGSGTNTVAVSNLLSGFSPGFTYRGRLVASNALALVRGGEVLFGTPLLTMNGPAVVTNECHSAFTDPGATAISALRAVAAGEAHGLVLKSDETVVAWGRGNVGQTTIPAGLSNVIAVAGGYFHSLALKTDGTIAAWGYDNYGQATVPAGLSNVVAIARGGYHNLVLKSNGTVVAWGYNGDGELDVPLGLSNAVAIAGGGYHSLALKSDGTVVVWGRNLEGQRNIPVGLSNVVALAGGDTHSLALKSDGTIAAWGGNGSGQSIVPPGLSNVVAIAGGHYHSLALMGDGTVAAWGDNYHGQTTIPAGLSNVMAIAAGGWFSLALKSDGTVAAWGRNDFGQVFVPAGLNALPVVVAGTFSTNNAPGIYAHTYNATNSIGGIAIATRTIVVQDTLPPIVTLQGNNPLTNQLNVPFIDPGATAVDTCSGNLAVTTNGTVNEAVPGRYPVSYIATDVYGNSTTNTRTVFVGVLPSVTTLPVTDASNTVATLNGTVSPGSLPVTVWFEWWPDGGSSTNLTALVTMSSDTNVVTVSNLLSGLSPGTIYSGRLVGSNDIALVRGVDVLFGTPLLTLNGAATMTNECHAAFTDPGAFTGTPLGVAGGFHHSLALQGDGTVVAWGRNDYDQTILPVGLSNVVAIAGGGFHSLAIKSNGTVAAWGRNIEGQTTIPVGLSNVVAVAGGFYHSLALKSDGTVAAWGYNGFGQTNIPVGLSNVVAIAGGYFHSLALRGDGTVAAWGYNGFSLTNIPVGLSNVVAIAAGSSHNMALKSDRTVIAWGQNFYGQTTIPAGLSNVVAIAAGGSNSLALKRDGTVVAWGQNFYGQSTMPAGLSNVVAIAGGGSHSLALKNDGTVTAWGYNAFGQTIIPAGLSTFTVIATAGGTFHTNNLPGTYTRIYSASNSLGGIATATRTIVVLDTLPPVITVLGSNPLTILTNTPFVDLGATALDACGGSSVVTANNLVNVAVPGIYTVSYIATDSLGNSATNTRIVNVVAAPPQVISPVRLGNGTFQFGFTNQPGVGFTVWVSTNVALPLAQWGNLGAPVEAPAGTFIFTDPQATNKAQRFYRVSSP